MTYVVCLITGIECILFQVYHIRPLPSKLDLKYQDYGCSTSPPPYISLDGFILDNPLESCVTNLLRMQGVPTNMGRNRRLEYRLLVHDFQYTWYFITYI